MQGFDPVQDREWYPWQWPTKEWFKKRESNKDGKDEIKAILKQAQKYALNDMFFFCDEVMRDPYHKPLVLGLHDELCFITQWADDAMIIIPRNHLKTTILTVAYCLWRIARNPNIRIFVASDTLQNSRLFVGAIKSNVEHNKRLRMLFPNLRPQMVGDTKKREKWGDEMLLFKRTRYGLKEPTILPSSGKKSQTGWHFDLMIYDDIITPDNVTNNEQIQKRIDWKKSTTALQDRGTNERVIGTPYNDKDLLSKYIREESIPYYKRPYIENGEWIWDTLENRKYVEKNKRDMTPYMFNCQFMCDPVPKGEELFPENWFKNRWNFDFIKSVLKTGSNDPEEIKNTWMATHDRYIGIDLNRAKDVKKENDYMVVMAVGVDVEGRRFIYDFYRGKPTTPLERIDICIKWMKKFNPLKSGIEVYGGDENLVQLLKLRMQKEGIPSFRLKRFEVTPHMDNLDYIMETQIDFELERVFLGEDHKFSELENELMRAGVAEHDDLAVTFAKIINQLIKSKKPKKKPKPPKEKGYMGRIRDTQPELNWMTV